MMNGSSRLCSSEIDQRFYGLRFHIAQVEDRSIHLIIKILHITPLTIASASRSIQFTLDVEPSL